MPTLPFLGGVANYMFFSIPYFMWAIVFLGILGVLICGLWYFFIWYPLTPYHGVLWSTIKKTGMSFVFDDNMVMDLITDRSSKVIFAETFKEAQEAEGDNTKTPAATIGKVHTDFIFDPDKWTYPNSYQHKIIEDVAEHWNDNHPEDQIRTLYKFSKYLNAGEFDIEYAEQLKGLKRKYVVPWARIRMMYKDREESGYFGFVMSLANTIRAIENTTYNGYAIPVLLLFFALDLMYFAAWFISRKPA